MSQLDARHLRDQLEKERGTSRELRTKLEQYRLFDLLPPEFRRLFKLAVEYVLVLDPTPGRNLDSGGHSSQFDRPLPHTKNAPLRRYFDVVASEKADHLSDEMAKKLGDPVDLQPPPSRCETCGHSEHPAKHRRRQTDRAREHLTRLLAHGAHPASLIKETGDIVGLSWSSLRRAADLLGVKRESGCVFMQDGVWWWRLPDGNGDG